jgi:hypothetical protein
MPRFRGDPAPTEMIETVINLKPRSEWRAGLTVDGLIADLDKQFPGISNAWTMPISFLRSHGRSITLNARQKAEYGKQVDRVCPVVGIERVLNPFDVLSRQT